MSLGLEWLKNNGSSLSTAQWEPRRAGHGLPQHEQKPHPTHGMSAPHVRQRLMDCPGPWLGLWCPLGEAPGSTGSCARAGRRPVAHCELNQNFVTVADNPLSGIISSLSEGFAFLLILVLSTMSTKIEFSWAVQGFKMTQEWVSRWLCWP